MKALLLGALLVPATLLAGEDHEHTEDCCELNLWTGEGVTIGNWLLPEINYQAAAGSSTLNPARLAVGHHDPDRHGLTQQAFEVAATIRLGQGVSLFGTYSGKVDLNDHWLSEFEEYYATFDLPGGIRVRGGRMQPRLGFQNELHIHHFDFVDQYLASARMFGEDPLVIIGPEVQMPVLRRLPKSWDDRLTVSFGAIPDAEEEDHAEFGPEPDFESDGRLFADWAATAYYRIGYNATEATRYEYGVSGAWGANAYGRHSQVYGLHFAYLWKPEGVAHDGHHHHGASSEFFRWKTEAFVRHFGAVSGHAEEEAHEEHGDDADEEAAETAGRRDEFFDAGFYTTLIYGFRSGRTEARLRGEYVTGVSEAGLPERWRISPAVVWRPTSRLPIHFKLQYNFDHAPSFGSEHSVWAQFNLSWGDCCAHQ